MIVGAALRVAVTYSGRGESQRVNVSGAGAIAVSGSAHEIRTRVQWSHVPGAAALDERDGVTASRPGAVGVGGDAAGPISTDVTSEVRQRDDQA